jgi:hypothetical protein
VRPAEYIAIGDSMSMDLYPALDAGATDVAVALERTPIAGQVAPIGAASLFFRNDDALWPDVAGNDLSNRFPGITMRSLASDGATIGDVFGEQLPMVGESDAPTLFTLTIGGEDLFSAFSAKPKKSMLDRIVADLGEAYEVLIGAIRRSRPSSSVIVNTICDPSDRIGRIQGVLEDVGRLPLAALDTLNANVRAMSNAIGGVVLADAYLEFLGHGASVEQADRWFWKRSPLEPNARGAHELRLVWLDALDRIAKETR